MAALPQVLVAVAIVLAWGVLLGSAYASRAALGMSRQASVSVVTIAYLLLCVPVLAWFGLNRTGLFAVTGLGLPCAAGIALALVPRRGNR